MHSACTSSQCLAMQATLHVAQWCTHSLLLHQATTLLARNATALTCAERMQDILVSAPAKQLVECGSLDRQANASSTSSPACSPAELSLSQCHAALVARASNTDTIYVFKHGPAQRTQPHLDARRVAKAACGPIIVLPAALAVLWHR